MSIMKRLRRMRHFYRTSQKEKYESKGSTSMAALMKEIADAYMKINTHATIQVTATDSKKGLNSVMSGYWTWQCHQEI